METNRIPANTFGDRFELHDLPLPRAAAGYAVQMLDTDTLLDRHTGKFLPVRSEQLNGLFDSFDSAFTAAEAWVAENAAPLDEHCLAIVPASYDNYLERHVLIYGVLCSAP